MSKRRKQRQKQVARNRQRQMSAAAVSLPRSPWDHGATGLANRSGLIIEERGERDPATGKMRNPNKVTGARRETWLDRYLRRGWITPEGHAAGTALHEAWQRIQIGTSPAWLRERVDSSPKPDVAVGIQIDRRDAYARIWRLVPPEDRQILHWVCCANRAISGMRGVSGGRQHNVAEKHLREALIRLSNRINRA